MVERGGRIVRPWKKYQYYRKAFDKRLCFCRPIIEKDYNQLLVLKRIYGFRCYENTPSRRPTFTLPLKPLATDQRLIGMTDIVLVTLVVILTLMRLVYIKTGDQKCAVAANFL
ncbi:hypothetical protein AADEFJLK_00058 [Methylovulum psychrotolerans]|uniref:Uncharacterized protein n=1 Tax=Methylovulum psychrotolerans TaxID=1704499 RepID=A0A2S5CQF3_9GAMM|nr:hypothetical protein AADEFJLK_00058 [Methylovulum psychrotolerans]